MSDALTKVPLPTLYYPYYIFILAGIARGSFQLLRRGPLLGRPFFPRSPLWCPRLASHRPRPSRPTPDAREDWRELSRAPMSSPRKVGILYVQFVISLAFSIDSTHLSCLPSLNDAQL